MSFNSTSLTNLMSSITGNMPILGSQDFATQMGVNFNIDDSVQITGSAQLEGTEDAEAVMKAQRENFDKSFTTEDVAALFGKDASELTEQQSKDLSFLLFNISQENARRKEEGEDPLTKDELNEFIKASVTDYKSQIEKGQKAEETKSGQVAAEDQDDQEVDSLGQTLAELGIEELTDEQMEGINKALDQYENGEEVTAAKDAKAAKEAKEAEEAKKAEEAKQAEQAAEPAQANEMAQQAPQAQSGQPSQSSPGSSGAAPVGSSGSVGSPSSVGSVGNVGSASPAAASSEAASASNTPEMAEDLQGLQQQKAEAQTKVGDLGSQIESKKSEINQRKSDIAKEIGTDGLSPQQKVEQQKNQTDYDKAKADYDRAQQEKAKVQQDNTQTNQDIAQNQQNLYTKAAEKQAKSAELSSAQNELSSLKPPSAPSGDDKEAKAAYDSAKAEYDAKKAELQAKVDQLKAEEKAIQSEITKLEQKNSNLERRKATQEQRLTNYEEQMTRAQSIMDEKMAAIQEGNPAVKEAIEQDEQLQALETEISNLESQKSEQEKFIKQLDNQIALKEKQDTAVQQLRQEEAQEDFEEALNKAGNPTGELKNPDPLGLDSPFKFHNEREAVDVTDPEKAGEAIEWAREALERDPNNEKAQAVLDSGSAYLEQRQASAENAAVEAVNNLPDGLKDAANAHIQEAIANADGRNVNDVVREAIADYTKGLLDKDDLSDEDRALVQTAADATAASVKADERYHQALEAESEVEFYKAVDKLPENAKAEAYAMRDSINALDRKGACQSVTDAYADIAEYLEKHPDTDLDMQTAKSMFGDYGPVALAALQDESGEMATQLLDENNYADFEGTALPDLFPDSRFKPVPQDIPNGGGYKGDTTSMYRDNLIDMANRNVESFSEKYNEAVSSDYSPYSRKWKNVDSMAKDAEGWKNLSDEYSIKMTKEKETGYAERIAAGTLSEAAIKAMSEPTLEDLMSGSTEFGLQIAQSSLAEAQRLNTTGWCYAGVSGALGRLGINIGGPSAYCAVGEIDSKYPDRFVKFTSADISKDQLKQLPAGAIVVYGAGSGYGGGKHGHIYVSQGNGQETSDHVANVYPEGYGNEYYVYFPK